MLRRSLLRPAAAIALCAGLTLPAQAQDKSFTVWVMPELAPDLREPLAAMFEAANPGVDVVYMDQTGSISDGAVQAAIQSDAGPDVLLTNAGIGRISIVVNSKLIQPLTAQYSDLGWKDKIYPWLYDLLSVQFGGQIYEVPDGLDAIGLWHHKDLFEANGWTVGNTWEEFATTLEKIRASGIDGIAVGARKGSNGGHLLGNFLQSAAGSDGAYQVITGAAPWNEGAALSAAERVTDFVSKGYISTQMAGLDADQAQRVWFNKRAAFIFAGPWLTVNAAKNEYPVENMVYTTIPSDLSGESKPTGGVGWSWIVPVSSKHPDLAIKWIDFILSDEVMRLRTEHVTNTRIPVRDIPDLNPALPMMASIYETAASGVGYNPSVYVPGEVLDTYFQVIQGLIAGQVSAVDGMTQIQGKMPAM